LGSPASFLGIRSPHHRCDQPKHDYYSHIPCEYDSGAVWETD
jgi:hypothetical protein